MWTLLQHCRLYIVHYICCRLHILKYTTHRRERGLPGGQWMGVGMLPGVQGKERRLRNIHEATDPMSHGDTNQADSHTGRTQGSTMTCKSVMLGARAKSQRAVTDLKRATDHSPTHDDMELLAGQADVSEGLRSLPAYA